MKAEIQPRHPDFDADLNNLEYCLGSLNISDNQRRFYYDLAHTLRAGHALERRFIAEHLGDYGDLADQPIDQVMTEATVVLGQISNIQISNHRHESGVMVFVDGSMRSVDTSISEVIDSLNKQATSRWAQGATSRPSVKNTGSRWSRAS